MRLNQNGTHISDNILKTSCWELMYFVLTEGSSVHNRSVTYVPSRHTSGRTCTDHTGRPSSRGVCHDTQRPSTVRHLVPDEVVFLQKLSLSVSVSVPSGTRPRISRVGGRLFPTRGGIDSSLTLEDPSL